MRSLYEKLNSLDDSLAASKRIVNKKNLTESFSTKAEWEELDSAETMDDERNWQPLRLWKNKTENKYVIIIGDNYPWEGYANMEFDNEAEAEYEFAAYLNEPYYNTDYEDEYDDDIEEMLTEEVYDPYPAGKYGDLIFNILDNCSGDAIINFMYEYSWPFYKSGDSISDVYDKINNYLDAHSGYGLWSDLDKHFN